LVLSPSSFLIGALSATHPGRLSVLVIGEQRSRSCAGWWSGSGRQKRRRRLKAAVAVVISEQEELANKFFVRTSGWRCRRDHLTNWTSARLTTLGLPRFDSIVVEAAEDMCFNAVCAETTTAAPADFAGSTEGTLTWSLACRH
jgi:hypothetical protein